MTDTREALAAAAEAIRLLLETLGNSRPKKDLAPLYQRQAIVEKMAHEAQAKITAAISPAVKPTSAEELADKIVADCMGMGSQWEDEMDEDFNMIRSGRTEAGKLIAAYSDAEYQRGYEAGKATVKPSNKSVST